MINVMKFRPCIDIHKGKVKQIVGSTLSDKEPWTLKENFVSVKPPSYYAKLFRKDGLNGGHVIMLGHGNEEAALDALTVWPGGLQIGGGITVDNAGFWLDHGAAAVIVTSFVFKDGRVHEERLKSITALAGKERLVLDLSCRKRGGDYLIVTDRWQVFTDVVITKENLEHLSGYCFEFLIHAADVEGKCSGVDGELVGLLSAISPIPTTYAGGARSMDDVLLVKEVGMGRIDITVGSALDIFGGKGVKYRDLVEFNRKEGAVFTTSD
jgi:phosphoribosylformimino-5-aminoimidazole carboxamide ribotide isomerase